jgi:histidine triad (HIT) family protein
MAQAETVAGCEFCAIGSGTDSSVEVVAEGEEWIAFFPLEPATPGHTLLIPKSHVKDLWELNEPLSTVLMRAVIDVGRAINAALDPGGMNLITSAGGIAEQTVFHLHMHLLPRWADDGFGPIWTTEDDSTASELAERATQIRQAFARFGSR